MPRELAAPALVGRGVPHVQVVRRAIAAARGCRDEEDARGRVLQPLVVCPFSSLSPSDLHLLALSSGSRMRWASRAAALRRCRRRRPPRAVACPPVECTVCRRRARLDAGRCVAPQAVSRGGRAARRGRAHGRPAHSNAGHCVTPRRLKLVRRACYVYTVSTCACTCACACACAHVM